MGWINIKFVSLVFFTWTFECESLSNRTEAALTDLLAEILRNRQSGYSSDSLRIVIGALLEETEQDTKIANMEARISSLQSQLTDARGLETEQDTKITNLEARISSLQSQLTDARGLETKQDTMITNLEARISSLQSQLTHARGLQGAQSNTITNLAARLSSIEASGDPVVAFSARVKTNLFKLRRQQTIRFQDVVTNLGGNFNPQTSIFRCPVDGVYQFVVTILSKGGEIVETELIAAQKDVMEMYSGGSTDRHGSGTNSVLLKLKAGDQVYVRINGAVGNAVHWIWSTFNGFLVRKT